MGVYRSCLCVVCVEYIDPVALAANNRKSKYVIPIPAPAVVVVVVVVVDVVVVVVVVVVWGV